MLVEAVWRMTPTMKIRQARMMDGRRPIASAREPAASAPKKVPAERMEVMSDFWEVEIL